MVSRVGASGGGKTYKKARPSTYYAVLAVIVVVGLGLVGYSRYELTHPVVVSNPTPHLNTLAYGALATETCGTAQSYLAEDSSNISSFVVLPQNVLKIFPLTKTTAGVNSTAQAFLSTYTGLKFNANSLTVGTGKTAVTYNSGEKCKAGTKYAGQVAYPVIAYWSTISQQKPTMTNKASSVHLDNSVMVTFAFEPKGIEPKRPSNTTIEAMVAAQEAASTTTTTSPVTTTLPVTTTTVKR